VEDVAYTRRERYEEASSLPVFAFAVLFVVGLIEVVSGPGDTGTGRLLVAISWVAFALDLWIRVSLEPQRRAFLHRHWFEVVAIAIPFFRVGMVLYVFVRLARRRGRLVQKVQVYAAYLTILVVIFGALLVLAVERDYPGSDIKNYGDALWWAVVTVTTVGYGDFVPVSPEGRAIAVLMLVNGVVLISVVTAIIAARFVSDQDEGEARITLDLLDERLQRIEAALADLTAAGGADPDGPGASGTGARPPS